MTEMHRNSEAFAIGICNNLDTDAGRFSDEDIMRAINVVLNQTMQHVPRKTYISICKYLMRRIESNG